MQTRPAPCARAELAIASRHHERVSWGVSGFGVRDQLEAIRQQRSQHQLPLVGRREWRRGLRDDIEAIVVDPARSTEEAIGSNVVGLLNQQSQRNIRRRELIPLRPGTPLDGSGFVRFDGRHLEGGLL